MICSKSGCARPVKSAGLCALHLRPHRPCSVPDCGDPVKGRGLCHYHYAVALADGKLPGDETLKWRRDGSVARVAVSVTREAHATLKSEAAARAISVYRLAAEILEAWAVAKSAITAPVNPPLATSEPSPLE